MISIVVAVVGGGGGGGGFVYIREGRSGGKASVEKVVRQPVSRRYITLISFRRSQGIPSAYREKVSFCKERKSGQVQP
jgi:hypothetical protein